MPVDEDGFLEIECNFAGASLCLIRTHFKAKVTRNCARMVAEAQTMLFLGLYAVDNLFSFLCRFSLDLLKFLFILVVSCERQAQKGKQI